ncbi:hypothetical protein [Helicobacter sp. MIT 14-3879]|uniref:hypothetical protein n=1 Tax=Helicobacter sp. MIT 14-3879 TaxID=2040649 RepID=UPI0011C070E9|nr:hypothetical protein [Helicobacter sp. MIT 14-3879]
MKKQFQWDKFIPDCFLCFGLMVVFAVIMFVPTGYISLIVIELIKVIFSTTSKIIDTCYHMALILNLNCIFFILFYIFLYRIRKIQYRFYSLSIMCCFILISMLLWYFAYCANYFFSHL